MSSSKRKERRGIEGELGAIVDGGGGRPNPNLKGWGVGFRKIGKDKIKRLS